MRIKPARGAAVIAAVHGRGAKISCTAFAKSCFR
jgi:hypothetical protein